MVSKQFIDYPSIQVNIITFYEFNSHHFFNNDQTAFEWCCITSIFLLHNINNTLTLSLNSEYIYLHPISIPIAPTFTIIRLHLNGAAQHQYLLLHNIFHFSSLVSQQFVDPSLNIFILLPLPIPIATTLTMIRLHLNGVALDRV